MRTGLVPPFPECLPENVLLVRGEICQLAFVGGGGPTRIVTADAALASGAPLWFSFHNEKRSPVFLCEPPFSTPDFSCFVGGGRAAFVVI